MSSLDWTSHINLISRKVNKTVGIMKYVSNNLPDNILWSLYFTLVNPHYDIMNMVLLYGLLKYSSLAKNISQKAIRMITSFSPAFSQPPYISINSAVAKRPRDASCLSVVSFIASIVQYLEVSFLLLVTSTSNLPVRTIRFCSVVFGVTSSLAVIHTIHGRP